ncbi:MAG: Hpt domain-containing protein [Lachnospiraceae bacterium]|jgi:FOG: HPt domain|uniref:Hpt domain-containing protein n=1 Tax=Roseburia sp. 1XD42-69 TaxID=2320088 RepID=UPI000EA21D8E|nr:Hpt domain-containing protein [Roseburia sp. 1XD42-69]MCI8875689.1 Hpt domain-containing protein [Lachnospiraceae bacterium]MCX4318204.1 Hpt domain-containing protein [Lachnospiraceae bacterium]RKJ67779.1 Hpt domain-containing protein [Roseburia sp. 1XD42-69]
MDENKKRELVDAGVNVDSALDRFMGNEKLLMRFLLKFSNDTNYERLKTAMEKEDYKEAFEGAHALKGLSGNLSLDALYEAAGKVTEGLRHENYEEAKEWMPKVTEEYERTAKVLNTLEG